MLFVSPSMRPFWTKIRMSDGCRSQLYSRLYFFMWHSTLKLLLVAMIFERVHRVFVVENYFVSHSWRNKQNKLSGVFLEVQVSNKSKLWPTRLFLRPRLYYYVHYYYYYWRNVILWIYIASHNLFVNYVNIKMKLPDD